MHFLLSIREDAWAKLDRFEGRIPALFANYVRVDHLDREAASEAIEGPIGPGTRRCPRRAAYAIEPALVDAVLAATAGGGLSHRRRREPGRGRRAGDRVEAPFLQLVLDRLWRETVAAGEHELTLAPLEALGGAARIVETHLVDALGALDPARAGDRRRRFRFSSARSQDEDRALGVRPRGVARATRGGVVAVLEKLASGDSGRILRPVAAAAGPRGSTSYELFHDILAEPILEWRRQYELRREREAEAQRQRAFRRRLARSPPGCSSLVLAFAGFAALGAP